MNWWNELTHLQKFFASVAMPATLFMILQFILQIIGFSNDSDVDSVDGDTEFGMEDSLAHDIFDGNSPDLFEVDSHEAIETSIMDSVDSDGGGGHEHGSTVRLFTAKGIVAFLAVGGWMGVAALEWGISVPITIILSITAGWMALFFVAWLVSVFLRMQQNGTLQLQNAIGREGEVYIPIPTNGRGKVNVIVQERLCELDAVTQAGRTLRTGEKIKVLNVTPDGILMVAPLQTNENG